MVGNCGKDQSGQPVSTMDTLNKTSTRRILIIDSHPLMQRGLTELINGERDLTVCGATDQNTALKAIAATKPDLVIAELSLDDSDLLRVVKKIHAAYKTLPLLLLTLHDTSRYTKLAQQAGACAVVSKRDMTETVLIEARRILDQTD